MLRVWIWWTSRKVAHAELVLRSAKRNRLQTKLRKLQVRRHRLAKGFWTVDQIHAVGYLVRARAALHDARRRHTRAVEWEKRWTQLIRRLS